MIIKVAGVAYDYDAGKLMISEAMEIKQRTGMNLQAWQQGLEDMDPFAVKALVYLLKQRAGEGPSWDTLDFDLGELEQIPDAAPEVDSGPKEAVAVA